MSSANDPVLVWLRDLVHKRGMNTAQLAAKAGMSRPRLRKLLSGSAPMLVSELMRLSNALELSMADMGLPDLDEATPSREEAPTEPLEVAPRLEDPALDPYGNHAEQLFQVGFALACNFLFVADVSQLDDSGIPDHVLEPFREGGDLMIQLDALYHKDNDPRFHDGGVTLTLSFDGLYDCTFPWSSIRRIYFDIEHDPEADDGPQQPDGGGPHLRLVT